MTIKVALIGAGGIGEAHSNAYALIPEARISAVVDVRPERAELIAGKHNARPYYSLEEMLSKEAVDMVDICTPSFLHKQMVIQCLEKGLHVLSEKPMAMTMADAEQILESLQEHRRKYMVAQVIRFWPEYRWLKETCEAGSYGRLLQASFVRISAAPLWSWENWYVNPELSGRAPFEMGIHDIDFICYLLGKPDAVFGRALERLDVYTSILDTQFYYPDGPSIEAHAAWYNGPLPFNAGYRAVFENAVVEYKNDELMVYAEGERAGNKVDLAAVVMESSINLQNTGPIYNEIAYFVDCVLNDRYPQVLTPQDSLVSLGVLMAALESARSGKVLKI